MIFLKLPGMLFVISETGKRAYNVVGVFGANFLEYSFDASGNTATSH